METINSPSLLDEQLFDPPIIQQNALEYFGYELSGQGLKSEEMNIQIFGLETESGSPAEVTFCCTIDNEDEGFLLPYSFAHYQEELGVEDLA